tara:strand:+ start:2925 stop:3860 length:936 start_codon:yes stop_codon:yes gene_type:complete
MKITEHQLRKLISEALKGLRYASKKTDGGYDFLDAPPEDMESAYGKKLSSGLGDVKAISSFFENSIQDVNLIFVPDAVFYEIGKILWDQKLTTDVVFKASDFFGFLDTAKAAIRGMSKELEDVRSLVDGNAINVVVQYTGDKDPNTFPISPSWLAHDVFGHVINRFGGFIKQLGYLLDNIKYGMGDIEQGGSVDKKLGLEYMDGLLGVIKRGELSAPPGIPEVMQGLAKDFNDAGFTPTTTKDTPGLSTFDYSASVFAWYFAFGSWPPTIQKASKEGLIDAGFLKKLETYIKDEFKKLLGRVLVTSHGDFG